MSMMRKLFRPGKGQTVARYTSAFINASAATYPGDLVCWDITAPTDQGSSGVLEGKTLGSTDYLYVILPPAAAAAAAGLQAGLVRGTSIEFASSTASVVDDTLAVIQTWGVAPYAWIDSGSVVAGDLLGVGATTGEWTMLYATDGIGTDSTIGESVVCGFALAADASRTRATTGEQFAPIFVRCDN
jgi:hypothetical protein